MERIEEGEIQWECSLVCFHNYSPAVSGEQRYGWLRMRARARVRRIRK